jgi:hypothetical protein
MSTLISTNEFPSPLTATPLGERVEVRGYSCFSNIQSSPLPSPLPRPCRGRGSYCAETHA